MTTDRQVGRNHSSHWIDPGSCVLTLLILLCAIGIYQIAVARVAEGGLIALGGVMLTLAPAFYPLLRSEEPVEHPINGGDWNETAAAER